jgi:beta-glucosidase
VVSAGAGGPRPDEHDPIALSEGARGASLDLENLVMLTGGSSYWEAAGIPAADIGPLLTSDGPNGVRGPRWGDVSTCLPSATALAASWNPALVEEVGTVLGAEAHDIGASILLAPTVNLHRHPLGGRSFECFSEDPLLTSAMAVAYVRGVQATKVACSIKHLVCNDQETERMSIDVEVDERALRELYLAPFEAAVKDAGVWSIMAAYNQLRGRYCSESAPLLRGVLRDEWGFDGVVVSDYFGTHSAEALEAGLDLEMPGPPQWLGEHLLDALAEGRVSEAAIRSAADRLLLLRARVGESPVPLPEPARRAAVARQAAAEGIVLLSNDGVLPLDPARISRVAVIGPAAGLLCVQGGGAAEVTPPRVSTPLEALRSRLGGEALLSEPGCAIPGPVPLLGPGGLHAPSGAGGMEVEYFAGPDLGGEAVFAETFAQTRLIWSGSPGRGLEVGRFSARARSRFVPDRTGRHDLGLCAVGRARAFLDGALILDTEGAPVGGSFFGMGSDEVTVELELVAGRAVDIELEYSIDIPGLPLAAVSLGARFHPAADAIERAVEAARAADVALVVVGTSSLSESEGEDRSSLGLPGEQDALIRAVAAVNPATVVVVNAGAPVSMDWADEVAAIAQLWYPGQEGGEALAEVLLGERDASGRLPTTFPRRLEDTPAFHSFPGRDGLVRYEESILVGYRHYDTAEVEPRFCFGHGLSYTTFDFRQLELLEHDHGLTARFEVANVGARAGTTVAQLYVRRPRSTIPRAERELRAFRKLALEPGEVAIVELELGRAAFRHWDESSGGWRIEAGPAAVLIGASSRDVRLSAQVELDGGELEG